MSAEIKTILTAHDRSSVLLPQGESLVSLDHRRCGFIISINSSGEVRADHATPLDTLYSDRIEALFHYRFFEFGLLPRTLQDHSPNVFGLMNHVSKGDNSRYSPHIAVVALSHTFSKVEIDATWRDFEAALGRINTFVAQEDANHPNSHFQQYALAGIDLEKVNQAAVEYILIDESDLAEAEKFNVVAEHQGDRVYLGVYTLGMSPSIIREASILI